MFLPLKNKKYEDEELFLLVNLLTKYTQCMHNETI